MSKAAAGSELRAPSKYLSKIRDLHYLNKEYDTFSMMPCRDDGYHKPRHMASMIVCPLSQNYTTELQHKIEEGKTHVYVVIPTESNHTCDCNPKGFCADPLCSSMQITVAKHGTNRVKGNLAVCTKALFGASKGFHNGPALIEFIEYYKAMGAAHVTLYNLTISGPVSCLLRQYISTVRFAFLSS